MGLVAVGCLGGYLGDFSGDSSAQLVPLLAPTWQVLVLPRAASLEVNTLYTCLPGEGVKRA